MTWVGLAVFSIAVYRPSIRANDWPYFLFAFGVVANAALGVAITGVFPDSLLTNNGFVGGLLLIAAYLTARTLTDTVWKAVLAFIAVEAAAIYVQLALGLRFFFPDQQMITAGSEFKFVREIGGESLWYLIRPQGLSISSTIAGAKMLLGILIAYMVPFPRRLRWTIIAFLLGALLLNFKRSGILSVGVLGVIVFTLDVADSGWQKRHTILSTATVLTALFALGAIIAQLTRETVETLSGISMDLLLNQLSGRTEIWQETWKFIRDNLFFGNFSRRYTVTSGGYAHSSLLTLVATHGLFLALVMVWFYLKRLWRKPLTLILLVPLLFDTLFQEHIFWYISMFDIFVLYLLTTRTTSRYWLTPWPENNEMENSRRTLAARAGT